MREIIDRKIQFLEQQLPDDTNLVGQLADLSVTGGENDELKLTPNFGEDENNNYNIDGVKYDDGDGLITVTATLLKDDMSADVYNKEKTKVAESEDGNKEIKFTLKRGEDDSNSWGKSPFHIDVYPKASNNDAKRRRYTLTIPQPGPVV